MTNNPTVTHISRAMLQNLQHVPEHLNTLLIQIAGPYGYSHQKLLPSQKFAEVYKVMFEVDTYSPSDEALAPLTKDLALQIIAKLDEALVGGRDVIVQCDRGAMRSYMVASAAACMGFRRLSTSQGYLPQTEWEIFERLLMDRLRTIKHD